MVAYDSYANQSVQIDPFANLKFTKVSEDSVLDTKKELSNDTFVLIRQYQSSDTGIRTKQQIETRLIQSNLGLVKVQAAKLNASKDNFEDLVSEGKIGLLEAIKRFNVDSGNAFSTYAVPWIRKFQLKFLERNRSIRVPDSAQRTIRKINKLTDQGVNDPIEIAAQLGKAPEYIYDCIQGAESIQKLPTLLNGEDCFVIEEKWVDPQVALLKVQLAEFDPDTVEACLMRVDGWRVKDIAAHLGWTAQQVSSRIKETFALLKSALTVEEVEPVAAAVQQPLPAWMRCFVSFGLSPKWLAHSVSSLGAISLDMKHKLTKAAQRCTSIAAIAAISTTTLFVQPKPTQANPFSGLFSGILRQVKGTGLGILKTAWSNPVGTFRLLNERVFKVQGTEKYLQYYDKYGKYLKYVPGVGGQVIPPSLVIDVATQQAGLNGVPRDLNAVLDAILGPSKGSNGAPPGSSGCFNPNQSCNQYSNLLAQIQREAVIGSTGAAGLPDPSVIRATITEAANRGLSPDAMSLNRVPASIYASNESDRKIARAKSSATLGEQGQQQLVDTVTAIDEGLTGVTETAKQGLETTVTQDAVKALLSVTAQSAGFLAIDTINGEQEKLDRALLLNQLANLSQAQDATRRGRDAEVNASALRLIYRSRMRSGF